MEDFLACSGSPYTEFLSPRGVLTTLRCSRGLDRADSVEAAFEIPSVTLSAVEASSVHLQLQKNQERGVEEQFMLECLDDGEQMVLVTRKTSQVTTVVNLGIDDDGPEGFTSTSNVLNESDTSTSVATATALSTSGAGRRESAREEEVLADASETKSRESSYGARGGGDSADGESQTKLQPDPRRDLQSDSQASSEVTEQRHSRQDQEPLQGSIAAARSQATAAISSLRPALQAVRKIWRSEEASERGNGAVERRGFHGGEGGWNDEVGVRGDEGDGDEALEGGDVVLKPMSAAMSNTVYECVWLPHRQSRMIEIEKDEKDKKKENEKEKDYLGEKRVLVRLYGPAASMLLKREHEEAVTRAMSDLGLGPKLLASFGTGRVEQFLQAKPLTATDMRRPETSQQIAQCMRRFHALKLPGSTPEDMVSCLWSRLRRWLSLAQLLHPWGVHGANPRQLGEKIQRLEEEAERRWGERGGEGEGGEEKGCGRWLGLCHMDVQHGNILRENDTGRIVLIDYEYSGYAHMAFDMANHFCEMAADYDSPQPHLLDYSRYPSEDEQRWFIDSYLATRPSHTCPNLCFDAESSSSYSGLPLTSSLDASDAEGLMQAVDVFLPVCHLHWFLWGIISAAVSDAGFDYMAYAQQRLHEFWKCMGHFEAVFAALF
ncbi:hypothetical protein CLOP_g7933 [Closterium sp. NIES-67]|nr:hypothetical protein CLOP_g7933 [Closterium sp. NIES-67]